MSKNSIFLRNAKQRSQPADEQKQIINGHACALTLLMLLDKIRLQQSCYVVSLY